MKHIKEFIKRRGWTDSEVMENFKLTRLEAYNIYNCIDKDVQYRIQRTFEHMVLQDVVKPVRYTAIERQQIADNLKSIGLAICPGMFCTRGVVRVKIHDITDQFIYAGIYDIPIKEFLAEWVVENPAADQILESWRVGGLRYADIYHWTGKTLKNVILRNKTID